ncbi:MULTISPECIES: LysR substrate-binding domain-containing protein [Pseudomonas]|jgi:DNA-binding transcriptional LysR family regulator|uniref:LysR family transcriptional regulator n=1 Tax=Pseudomonas soli TaxID=1306993 RepID=A0A1H9J7I6_9PSED|nr:MULTISPECIES: LysR substrate-binding domain-containing protein [Pseudomonas]AIN58031.1 LysR family transcriptional regulator [Pseudomonas soli]AUY32540.1 LysR family transcriptional regulator [Pseudomonas sp. PONIH3]MCX5506616.1 LysR substrate-binding domain-containing protein [Pseudomonas sp. BJa3]MDF9756373.1 DNA-binding transcriptional LysR family regulator [Pseudomonas hunanensis]MDT3712682.1 LysR substrate-binding domain-containing protein [Pseudomonas soli]
MHFDLADLRLLAAIAATGSLSKAAATFPVAVSAASTRLRLFEARSGLTLFLRKADGMQLTPAGRLVLESARGVLGEAQKLQDTLRELAGQRRITLHLAASTVTNSTLLPAVLGPFLADYPEVDLQLVEHKSIDVLRVVLAGECEIGVYDGNLVNEGVVSLPFRTERLVLLVPLDHPLAGRGQLRLADALGFPFVCLPAERAMQRFVEELAMNLAMPLKVRVRAPSFEAIAQLVAQHAGIAMLPETAAVRAEQELAVRRVALEERWATLELRICFRSWEALSSHGRQLVSFLSGQ